MQRKWTPKSRNIGRKLHFQDHDTKKIKCKLSQAAMEKYDRSQRKCMITHKTIVEGSFSKIFVHIVRKPLVQKLMKINKKIREII